MFTLISLVTLVQRDWEWTRGTYKVRVARSTEAPEGIIVDLLRWERRYTPDLDMKN